MQSVWIKHSKKKNRLTIDHTILTMVEKKTFTEETQIEYNMRRRRRRDAQMKMGAQ